MEKDPETGKEDITQIPLAFAVSMDDLTIKESSITNWLAVPVGFIHVNRPSELKVGETYELETAVNAGAYSWAKFELGSGTTEGCAELTEDGVLTIKKAGTIQFTATSLFDETKKATPSWVVTE